jgi:hypothetical protein
MSGTGMTCPNPEHVPGDSDRGICPGCYTDLSTELTRLNDRYMILLTENGELHRKISEAAQRGDIIPLPDGPRHGRHESGERGFEAVEGTDALQVLPRSRPAREDVVVLRVMQRTMGPSSGRSQLLTRAAAEALHTWLGWWLENGWPGVPPECGQVHQDSAHRQWRCDQPPGHAVDHAGPCTGWRVTDHGKPGRKTWALALAMEAAGHGARLYRPGGY